MTKEYLYESDLDNAQFLAKMEQMDRRVDAFVKSAAAKFATLQASVNRSITPGAVGGTGGRPASGGGSAASAENQAARTQIAAQAQAERERANAAREALRAIQLEEQKRATLAREGMKRIESEERARKNVATEQLRLIQAAERQRSNLVREDLRRVDQAERQRARAAREAAEAQRRFGAGGAGNQAAAIGRVTAAYYLLIRAVESAAKAVVSFFANLVKESVAAAANIESVGTSFESMFREAGPNVGATVLREIREEGLRLGTDLAGISRRILPLVESVDQLKQIGELVTELAALDPLQGTQGALVAINEALAGDLISIRRRFEIPTDSIRSLQQAKGLVDGLIEGLGQEINVRGLGFEVLEETADITFKRVGQRFQFLKEEFGTPILEALNVQFKDFLSFVEENDIEIQALVQSLGDLVAKVVELVGVPLNEFFDEGFLAGFEDFIVQGNEILSLVESIIAVFSDTSAGGGETIFQKVGMEIGPLQKDLQNLLKLMLDIQGFFKAVGAEWAVFKELGDDLLRGEISLRQFEDAVNSAGEAVLDEQLQKYNDALERQAEAGDEATKSIQARREALEEAAQADTSAADALLARNRAEADLADAQAELAEAEAEVAEERLKVQQKFDHDMADAIKKAGEAQLDLEQEYAEKRIDAARENAREIAKIFRDNARDIAKANLDLSRKEQDILAENISNIEEIEMESANERIKIEEDFQRELQEIRRRFDFQAEEAVRNNDAVALLRIRRQMQFELESARLNRDQNIADEDVDRTEEIEEERRAQEERLAEARLAHQRKLEDLQIALAAELEERRISYAEELEDLQISEERKRAEIQKNLERQIEELKLNLSRKLEELKASLAEEVAAVQEAEAAKLEAVRAATDQLQVEFNRRIAMAQRAAAAMRLAMNPGGLGSPGYLGGSGRLTPGGNASTPLGGNSPTGSGGDIGTAGNLGGSGRGGAAGATTIPTYQFPYSPTSTTSSSSVTNNNTRSADVALNLVDPTALSPAQLQAARDLIMQTLGEVL